MALISILVCSRISGNKNFGLPNLLESFKLMSSNYDNFEVLVKFDSDDKKVPKILPKLDTYPFKVKYLIEPRGRGYLDLHVFYTSLFSKLDERSVVLGAMGDDFVITQEGWDEIILSKVNTFPDQIFIIHGRPHPPESRENYQEQKFYLDFDINSLEDLHIIDEAPLWSRRLLDICGGFLNETDCWTLILEYFLWHRCGINRTVFLDQPFSYRHTRDDIDQQIALRWWTDRAWIFDFLRSRFYQSLVEQQAVNIYGNIKMSELSALPPPTGRVPETKAAVSSFQIEGDGAQPFPRFPASSNNKGV
ncbi:hypothetical protein ACFLX6_02850 [Chloroflexota bacterium]